mmetsp:Transcript_9299/g.42337  ORF Transcript_9299/g.42337 Transcript_9299/m.42337 type:complete len:395 (-) Transcript_9299:302-1486(-)
MTWRVVLTLSFLGPLLAVFLSSRAGLELSTSVLRSGGNDFRGGQRASGWLRKTAGSNRSTVRLDDATGLLRLKAVEAMSAEIQGDRVAPWRSTYDKTSVEFVIGTFDRPHELHRCLRALQLFVEGDFFATVIYLGSSDPVINAYEHVSRIFPHCIFMRRNTSNYFHKLLQTIQSSRATNFVIMSDDTIFFRASFIRKYATLQNMLETDLNARYSVQLRVSSRDNKPPLLASLLPSWGLPYSQVVDCTRNLSRSLLGTETFFTCCYDRQIDGSMFTRRTFENEMLALGEKMPANPGDLEGLWMQFCQSNSNWVDFTIFPVDRLLMNAGMALTTVRKDREHLEDNNVGDAVLLREQAVATYMRGCFLETATPDAYLMVDQTHGAVQSDWQCPMQGD